MKSRSTSGRITLRDLATHLGLSKTTVSVVMSGSKAAEAIPEKTRRRIERAAEKLGYRAHYMARSLRKSESMSVGIIVPEFSDGYFTLLMAGIEEFLISAGYFYFTVSHYWKPDLQQQYPAMLEERGVDGLLMVNTDPPQSHLPMVSISGHHKRGAPTTVMLDHEHAAHLLIEHLHGLGHRRIAFVHGQSWSQDTQLRRKAFVTAMQQFGLKIIPELQVTLDATTWTPDLGYAPATELLKKTRDFTALVCFNDTAAMGAIRAARDAGLRVPEDISVTGFDNIAHASFFSPSLTTVQQPLREMGKSAAQALIEHIRHPQQTQPAKLVHQPLLVARESTGHAPLTATTAKRSAK
ncbi:LacI family DNA-binding transcriptional regulator [Granulicella cerasi]|uniref:LacI family DNA-binding transcriptional regulator n=1 Tax=Granulicella cerasi TaxID=741063 RepID=A0ABW1ZBI0_9BACT|nr:LacI family DNA-binding transcriptional regulator [Granulicella cerasi]